MEGIEKIPLPEATEVTYPEADWPKRFHSVFDWYRAQSLQVRVEALLQWHREGKAHYMNGAHWVAEERFELWYSEQGNFFIELSRKGDVVSDRFMYFQSESCLRKYGISILGKAKELGYKQPKESY